MNTLMTNSQTSLSLLLIRNNSSGFDTLLQYLFASDIRLQIADSEEQGFTLFEEELPNIVLIAHSASLNAFDLTTRLRERWGCRAHVVIVGGDGSATHWKQASAAGALACLPDPDDITEAAAILDRLRRWMGTCTDTSQQLLEVIRTSNILDSLPWGIILLGHGEQMILANLAAIRLTGLPPQPDSRHLEDLFLLLYGANRDANLAMMRAALHGGDSWKDTVYCGQNGLTLRLELLPLAFTGTGKTLYNLITIQNISRCPTSQPYQTMLSAAAFDLIFSRHFTPRNQVKLAASIIEGTLPHKEVFTIAGLFNEIKVQVSSPGNLTDPEFPAYLGGAYRGQGVLLKEILVALYSWASESTGGNLVTPAISLQGRNGNKCCLRFSVTAPDRRLTRNSYQRGDEALAHQLAQSGLTAFKSLRGIGLATTLAALAGSTLIVKTVAREGKTALFDLWFELTAAEDTVTPMASQTLAVSPQDALRLWETVAEPLGSGVPLRILAAEDNPLEQLNIKSLIERMGYQVVLVGNGREAVEECENNHFDLILMDILMPVMDGFEAVRLIREQERFQGRHTPIVALTSYLLKAVQERCATVGMDGYLSKPVTQSKLEELINSFFAPQAAPPFSIFSSDDATTTSPAPVLNLQESITNLGSDVNFYREMLELFTTLGYQLLDEIIQRLQSESETDGLDRLAHKLKGMAANVGAAQLAEICRRMQESEEQFSNPAVCSAYLQELQDAQTALHATLKELDWQKAKEQYLSDKP